MTSSVGPGLPWEEPPEQLTLARAEIHIWRAWLDQAAPFLDRLESLLSEDEHRRARRFRFDSHRARFIARRGLLRVILGDYLRVHPARLRFSYGPFGKPTLSVPSDAGLQFNASHSDTLALYAVARDCLVGVDVERARTIPQAEGVVAQFLSPRETVEWLSLPRREQPQAFLRYWTRGEAGVKASGGSIAAALALRRSRAATAGWDQVPPFWEGGASAEAWDFVPAPGYIACLVCGPRRTPVMGALPDDGRSFCVADGSDSVRVSALPM